MGTALVIMGLKGIFALVPLFPSEGQPSKGGKRQKSFRLLFSSFPTNSTDTNKPDGKSGGSKTAGPFFTQSLCWGQRLQLLFGETQSWPSQLGVQGKSRARKPPKLHN